MMKSTKASEWPHKFPFHSKLLTVHLFLLLMSLMFQIKLFFVLFAPVAPCKELMSEALVRRQLSRQAALQQRVVMPLGGRVVSKEEGRAMSKKQQESAPQFDDNETQATAAPRSVFVESDVSKKIVTLRQQHNERGNLKAHLEAFREDLKVAKLVDTRPVRSAAAKLYAKNHTDFTAERNERARRAKEGPQKKKVDKKDKKSKK
jgi:hypothetical protein